MININKIVEERNKTLPQGWKFSYTSSKILTLHYKNKDICSIAARTEVEIMAIPFFVENLKIIYPTLQLDSVQSTISESSSSIITECSTLKVEGWQ